jgi:hypothetical protein
MPPLERITGQRRHIGAGVWLGQREGSNRLAARDARQVARLLFTAAGQADRARAQALHRKRKVGQAAVPRQRFADQADGARVDRVTHGMLQPAAGAERFDERTASCIDVGLVALRNMPRGPVIQFARQRAMARLEERPVERSRQLPSKTGFCFATKAL